MKATTPQSGADSKTAQEPKPSYFRSYYIEMRSRNQSIGLATVYRSLEALKLEGVVQVRTLASGEVAL